MQTLQRIRETALRFSLLTSGPLAGWYLKTNPIHRAQCVIRLCETHGRTIPPTTSSFCRRQLAPRMMHSPPCALLTLLSDYVSVYDNDRHPCAYCRHDAPLKRKRQIVDANGTVIFNFGRAEQGTMVPRGYHVKLRQIIDVIVSENRPRTAGGDDRQVKQLFVVRN